LAYAESVVPVENNSATYKIKLFDCPSGNLDIDDLFFRSIDLPHFNKITQAIEGISLLPIESMRYKERLAEYKQNGYNSERSALFQKLFVCGFHCILAQRLPAVIHGFKSP
jgi:hypothetical protein